MAKPLKSKPKQESRQIATASWSGPLPPPSVLEGFNAIIPDGAERVFKMAEREQEARHLQEKEIARYEHAKLDAERRDSARGQWLGGSIAITALLAATYTAYIQAPWQVSVALVGVPILGAIKAIVGKK